MASTVTSSSQIAQAFPKCGQKIGPDGELVFLLINFTPQYKPDSEFVEIL